MEDICMSSREKENIHRIRISNVDTYINFNNLCFFRFSVALTRTGPQSQISASQRNAKQSAKDKSLRARVCRQERGQKSLIGSKGEIALANARILNGEKNRKAEHWVLLTKKARMIHTCAYEGYALVCSKSFYFQFELSILSGIRVCNDLVAMMMT